MSKSIFLITIFIFCCTTKLWAQYIKLSAHLTDDKRHPVERAQVTFIKPDRSLQRGETDQNGMVILQTLERGKFSLQIEILGFENSVRNIDLYRDTLVEIVLIPKAVALKEVEIRSKVPLIEQKVDRIVFNVEASLSSKGTSVFQLLNKVPGLERSERSGVQVNGKFASIYLNNRLVRLAGEDLANYLNSISSDNVSKLEIFANPPANFDAQAGAVINIITKKNTADGTNANLVSGYTRGQYNRLNESINFNHRSGSFNVYGNYGFRTGKVGRQENEYINFEPANGIRSDWYNEKRGARNSDSHTYQLGVDHNLNKDHIIGFLMDGYNNSSVRETDVQTTIRNDGRSLPDSVLLTQNRSDGSISQYNFNLNYKGKLDTSGKTINFDIDYSPYRNTNGQQLSSITRLTSGTEKKSTADQQLNTIQKIGIFSTKLDFSMPVNTSWRLDMGLKYSKIDNDNIYDNYLIINGSALYNANLSNSFKYKENTSAAYGSLTGKYKVVSFNIGLRAEYTSLSGFNRTLNILNDSSYLKMFPSVFLQFATGKQSSLNLYFNKRINRPEYWRLNPFRYYSTPYTYLEGNPALRPAQLYSLELGYVINKKYSIYSFYNRSNRYFSNITQQDNVSKIFFDTQRNLDKSIQTGVYSSIPFSLAPWWDIYNYVRLSYKIENSGYLQSSYDYRTFTAYLSSTHTFTLSKKSGVNAELSTWYSSPGIQGIYRSGSRYDLSSGVTKTLFKGNGTLRLNVSDIFNTNRYKIDVNYLDQKNGFVEYNDTRIVSLSLSYKIGNQKLQRFRRRNTSSEDEKNRAN